MTTSISRLHMTGLYLIALVAPLFFQPFAAAQEGLPEARLVMYNNPGLHVPLGMGLWVNPLPYDYDADGVPDMVISMHDAPTRGVYVFRNLGTAAEPLFDKPVKISSKGDTNVRLSAEGRKDAKGYRPLVTVGNTVYDNFFQAPYEGGEKIEYSGDRFEDLYKRVRFNMWSFVDWDGDGDQDILVGIDTWEEYGWDDAYDSSGTWTNGPLRGFVHLLENVDGKYYQRGRLKAGDADLETYGAPMPCIADFDRDGDLDIICGEFIDGMTWFENTGTRQKPVLAPGRRLGNAEGEFHVHVEMIVPVAWDWDGDGLCDLFIGDEDSSISLLRNTGKTSDGMPLFENQKLLMQKAEALKFGALVTPFAVDFDGDGRQDIIAGNSAGNIAFIKNLGLVTQDAGQEVVTDGSSGARVAGNPLAGKEVSWAAPQMITVKGEPFRVMAGPNGSIQGPAEKKWGYTVQTVADMDGDGRLDIVFNSILGKVEWLRGLGGLEFEPARPVFVKGKTLKPEWNWWYPKRHRMVTQWRTTPYIVDWDGDGKEDLVSLDQEGWLTLYRRANRGRRVKFKAGERVFYGTNCSVYTNNGKGVKEAEPGLLRLNDGKAGGSGRRKFCFVDYDGDGALDLVIDSRRAASWFRNLGLGNDGLYRLEYKGEVSSTVLEGHTTCPTAADLDGDGKTELLIGAEDGRFYTVPLMSR